MRHLAILCFFAVSARAAELTLVLETDAARPSALLEPTWKELKRELDAVFQQTSLRINVQRREPDARVEASDIVLIRLKGDCRMEPLAPYFDEQGPLAWTHTIDGQVLPFSDVGCDRVRKAVSRAIFGRQRQEKDRLLGRALARVIAHEVMHIVGKTHTHSESGLFRAGLTGKDLVADRMTFDPQDLARLP